MTVWPMTVWPKLEYCESVTMYQSTKSPILILEKVQQRDSRFMVTEYRRYGRSVFNRLRCDLIKELTSL